MVTLKKKLILKPRSSAAFFLLKLLGSGDKMFGNFSAKIELMKKILKHLALPLIFLGTLAVFFVLTSIFFPTPDALLEVLRHYFELWGYPVLFISGVIEAIPIINLYFPGSSIILLGAAFSRQGTLNIFLVILVGCLAFILTYTLNYLVGYHGWHKVFRRFGLGDALDKTAKRIDKHGIFWIWISYVHPNLGALTSTAFGVLKLPLKSFYLHSFFAVLFWNTFWSFLMYFASDHLIGILTARWLVIATLLLFVGVKIIFEVRNNQFKETKF